MEQLLLWFFFAFIGGVITLFAPCSIPLLVGFFSAASMQPKKMFVNTALFSAGFICIFAVLGFAAGSFGDLLILYKRQIVLFAAIIFFIFGILTILGKSAIGERKPTTKKTLLFGAIMGLSWTGCVGPILAMMLVFAASTTSHLAGAALLAAYAAGHVAPLLLISLLAQNTNWKFTIPSFMKGKIYEIDLFSKTYYIHSTNLIAGLLFILLGILFLFNLTYNITTFFPSSWIDALNTFQSTITNTTE